MRRRIAVVALLLLLLLVIPPSSQAAPPAQVPTTVRVGQVDLSDFPRVTLYVTILGSGGDPIEDVDRADLQIAEDGRPTGLTDMAGLGQQRPVDVVFALDTTGSMGDYIEGVKGTAIDFARSLERRRRDYRLGLVTFGDTVREGYPLTDDVDEFVDWVAGQQADGGGDPPENALGALQEAAALSLRPEAQHLIVLITDADIHTYGDPADEEVAFDDPSLTMEETLRRLSAGAISVYAVTPDLPAHRRLVEQTGGALYGIGTDFDRIIDQLALAIANQYRFTYRSPRPTPDGTERQVEVTVGGASGRAGYTAPTERRPGAGVVEFYTTLPTPLEISTDPAVVGTNAFLAVLLALLFGLTSTVFNDTLNQHQGAIRNTFLGRVGGAIKRLGTALGRPAGPPGSRTRRILTYVRVGIFLLVTALIASFLEPAFLPLSWAGVGLFFSMLLSIGLVNLVYEGVQIWRARRLQFPAALELNPAGIVVALGCVFFSRLVGFVPGYLYGTPGGYALEEEAEMSRRREATIAGAGLGAAALLALLAWGLTLPTDLAQTALGATGVIGFLRGIAGGLQSVLLTLFFVGLEVVFLELFPLGPTSGTALFRWNKVVWGIAFAVAAFLGLHTLFTPESAYLGAMRQHSLQLLLALLALYSALTVGLWYLFEGRRRRREARACPACGHANEPGTRSCIQCGAPIPEQPASPQGLPLVVVIGALWLMIAVARGLAALGVGMP